MMSRVVLLFSLINILVYICINAQPIFGRKHELNENAIDNELAIKLRSSSPFRDSSTIGIDCNWQTSIGSNAAVATPIVIGMSNNNTRLLYLYNSTISYVNNSVSLQGWTENTITLPSGAEPMYMAYSK